MDASLMKSLMEGEVPERITVLQLITGLGVGGAERVVMELAGRLSGRGFQSVVVALGGDRLMLEQYPAVGFEVLSLGLHKNPWSFIKAVVALKRIIHQEGVTLIHAHMFHALVVGLICKLAQPTLKLVFTSHSSKGFSWLRRKAIGLTKVLRNADVVFVAGQHLEMNAEKTLVIPNGVSAGPAKAIISKDARARRVFLFVGRLEPAKDPVALIRAFAAMRHKNCELWMAGDGFMRPEVEREVELLGISDRVRLLGVRRDVSQLLEQADCFVMSSRWEGLPMAILEAGAVALPVVAPPVGAIPQLLAENCGYLVAVPELQNALDAVIDDYADAQERGKRLQDKVINGFSLDHMYRAHAELYRTLAATR